ncbi:uncharacterized protein N7515_006817 [Penicillium bovifimosum]|uniref:Translation initiation factor IF-2, mitochondrial n=1 Tax=Penicillium bovifimosum TaxID=126998 RepID=A0A9W9GVS3_9EURO|nr:uncharacterized protein N7515_006817 [Penicillium bovifimosum]KAJ5130778.1 hypothetical protein N7515_006817 [Penicillium bovifimosum]
MHRRPVCRLSRRAEWSNSACRTPSLTAYTIRRTLQSSATRCDSADPPDGNNDGTAAPSETPKPKFGSRWAPKQTTKPAGLSAAELAIRQNLITKSQPPPPPPPQQQRSWEQPRHQRNLGYSDRHTRPFARRDAGSRDRSGGHMKWSADTPRKHARDQPFEEENPFTKKESDAGSSDTRGSDMNWSRETYRRQPRNQERSPFNEERNPFAEGRDYAGSRDEQIANFRRARQAPRYQERNPFYEEKNPFASESTQNNLEGPSQSRRRNAPYGKTYEDWTCPNCSRAVFAYRRACPFCQTPRQTDAPQKPRITRDYAENPRSSQPRQSRPASEDSQKFQQLGDSLLNEMEGDGQDAARTTERDIKEGKPQTDQEKEDFKKNQWTWDMSALEQLKELEAQEQQPQKPVKRREVREVRKGPPSHRAETPAKEKNEQRAAKKAAAEAAPAPLYLPEFISVSNLADVIGVRPAQFVQRMEEMGFDEITYRDILDAETAGLVAAEFNFEAIFDSGREDLQAAPPPEDTSNLPTRPPVVTIMGHVDHGKTTILDWLRNSSVAASEHGGITQHIGAFSVTMPSGKAITFLDTPGHSAFLEMRRRGADVTDIVVLVVAADDSVKPQTIEAIKHATQARVPVIVAISKIDKEDGNPDRVKTDLSVHGIHVEDFGGDVQAIGVSGKTGQGMVELEEAIVALSEMLDHRADTTCNVEGWIIEASTKSYGRVASALIRRGTLRPGDVIVAGTAWARVRTLRNQAGVTISEATPGMPVEIDGWREQPGAGTELLQAPTEQKAKDVVDYRLEKSDTQKMGVDMAAINEARRELLEKRRRKEQDEEEAAKEVESTGPKPVNFILKADVDGSAEAVLNSVAAVGNNEVFANIIRSGVGPVSEFDIEHAGSAKGKIISFNQPIDPNIMRMAETEGVEIMDHNIIYKLIDDVKAILSEQLPPSVTTRVTGEAEIQQVFEITVKGREKTSIAGSRVRNGMINKTRKVRVLRGDEVVYDGTMVSLKNVKKDVTEMRKDTECGISFENWTAFEVGDHIQCYEEIFEKRYL